MHFRFLCSLCNLKHTPVKKTCNMFCRYLQLMELRHCTKWCNPTIFVSFTCKAKHEAHYNHVSAATIKWAIHAQAYSSALYFLSQRNLWLMSLKKNNSLVLTLLTSTFSCCTLFLSRIPSHVVGLGKFFVGPVKPVQA